MPAAEGRSTQSTSIARAGVVKYGRTGSPDCLFCTRVVQLVAVQLPAHRQRESLGSCKVHRTRVIPCAGCAPLHSLITNPGF